MESNEENNNEVKASTDAILNNLTGEGSGPSAEVRAAMLDERPTFNGRVLRPIRLSTLLLLERSGNSMVSGKPVNECPNLFVDACKVIWIQSTPIRDVLEIIDDPKEMEIRAFEIADEVDEDSTDALVDAVLDMIARSMKNRVVPKPDDDDGGAPIKPSDLVGKRLRKPTGSRRRR